MRPKAAGGSLECTSLGILCIGKKEIPVAIGVDEATLADGPGWMPDSALPGQAGMSVILGHRNRKHLRPLQDVEIGDSLCFRYPDSGNIPIRFLKS